MPMLSVLAIDHMKQHLHKMEGNEGGKEKKSIRIFVIDFPALSWMGHGFSLCLYPQIGMQHWNRSNLDTGREMDYGIHWVFLRNEFTFIELAAGGSVHHAHDKNGCRGKESG